MRNGRMKKRFELIKKMNKDRKYKPTDEEIHEAYKYLETCFVCGKPMTFWDRIFGLNREHGFEGDCHKRCPK